MGGKGKSKEVKANASIDIDDKAAARAKLRREIQQAKAELASSEKSGNSRWGRRDAADHYDSADRWGKRYEADHWGKREEGGRWGKRAEADRWSKYDDWGKQDISGRWSKRYDTDRWDTYEGGKSRQSWKGTDSDYKRTDSNKGSYDYKSGKGSSNDKAKFDNQAKGPGESKPRYKEDGEENGSTHMSVQDLESKLANTADVQKAKTTSVTTAMEIKGVFCEVRKHTDMGCAVVSMATIADRDAVLELAKRSLSEKGRPQVEIVGVTADMRPHTEGNTGIFVAWGHGKEKQSPLSPTAIAETFDNFYREIKGMPLSPIGQPVVEPAKPPSMLQGQQQQSATSAPVQPAMLPQMGQAQFAQAANAQQQMALLAQRQMLLQQMALAGQRPQPQQNMQQQMAVAFAAAAQATAQAMQMPNNMGNGVANSFPGNTPAVNAAMAQQQQQAFMRAEAPTFTPPAVGQQSQWPQQFQQTGQQSTDMTTMWYSNSSKLESSTFGQQSSPERRPLQIVDPQSGKVIETPAVSSSPSALDYLDVKPPTRRALTIVDPSSGKTVDTLAAVNFKPAEGKKPLSIIDPSSGSTVKI